MTIPLPSSPRMIATTRSRTIRTCATSPFQGGHSLKMLEPGMQYHTLFEDQERQFGLDFTFTGSHPPHRAQPGEPPFINTPHYDQVGHVLGTMTSRGEKIPLDCFNVSDRTWGPRGGPHFIRLLDVLKAVRCKNYCRRDWPMRWADWRKSALRRSKDTPQPITLASRYCAISARLKPISRIISSVCWPIVGQARVMAMGTSPKFHISPGCSIVPYSG